MVGCNHFHLHQLRMNATRVHVCTVFSLKTKRMYIHFVKIVLLIQIPNAFFLCVQVFQWIGGLLVCCCTRCWQGNPHLISGVTICLIRAQKITCFKVGIK